MAESAAFLILFIGHLPAIEPRYGARSRDYCLLEAGHMSQLLMMEAGTHCLGLCPIGEMNDEAVRSALRLESGDLFLQAMAGGKPAAACTASPQDWREELTRHLRTTLPESMIPELWLPLDRFPLTPNGKVNRAALAALAREAALLRDPAVDEAPASGLEESLARLVAGTLGVENVPVTARFFEMGCDSIQLVRLFARIRKEESSLGIPQPIKMTDLFEFPTVRLLARRLGAAAESCQALESAQARGRARARAARRKA